MTDFATQHPREYAWLKQFEGSWTFEADAIMEMGKPPERMTGHETTRMIGQSWIVSDGGGTGGFSSVTTIGFEPGKGRFVGTFIVSGLTFLWKYEGELDESGKVVALLTEGPNPSAGGKWMKFRDEYEIVDADHRRLTSFWFNEDGSWTEFMRSEITRVK